MKYYKISLSEKHYNALKAEGDNLGLLPAIALRTILNTYFAGGFIAQHKAHVPTPPPEPKRPSRELRKAIIGCAGHGPTGPLEQNADVVRQYRQHRSNFQLLSPQEGFDWSEEEAIAWVRANPPTLQEKKAWGMPLTEAAKHRAIIQEQEKLIQEVQKIFKDDPL